MVKFFSGMQFVCSAVVESLSVGGLRFLYRSHPVLAPGVALVSCGVERLAHTAHLPAITNFGSSKMAEVLSYRGVRLLLCRRGASAFKVK